MPVLLFPQKELCSCHLVQRNPIIFPVQNSPWTFPMEPDSVPNHLIPSQETLPIHPESWTEEQAMILSSSRLPWRVIFRHNKEHTPVRKMLQILWSNSSWAHTSQRGDITDTPKSAKLTFRNAVGHMCYFAPRLFPPTLALQSFSHPTGSEHFHIKAFCRPAAIHRGHVTVSLHPFRRQRCFQKCHKDVVSVSWWKGNFQVGARLESEKQHLLCTLAQLNVITRNTNRFHNIVLWSLEFRPNLALVERIDPCTTGIRLAGIPQLQSVYSKDQFRSVVRCVMVQKSVALVGFKGRWIPLTHRANHQGQIIPFWGVAGWRSSNALIRLENSNANIASWVRRHPSILLHEVHTSSTYTGDTNIIGCQGGAASNHGVREAENAIKVTLY